MRRRIVPLIVTSVFVALVAVLAVRELTRSGKTADPSGDPPAPPTVSLYRLTRSFPVSVPGARGIAITGDGQILLCGDGEIEVLSPTGSRVAGFIIDGTAECAAAGPDGTVYLGTGDHVTVLDPLTGAVTEWAVLDQRSIITSVAVSGGSVFICDAGTRRVWVFDSGGMLENMLDGFLVPSPYFDAASGPDGRAWIVDPGRRSIGLYDGSGVRSSAFGRHSTAPDGFSVCCNPTNIAVTADGSLATSEKGIMRVKLYGSAGGYIGQAAGPGDFPVYDAEIDLAAGAGGELYVLSPRIGRVLVFEENGGDS